MSFFPKLLIEPISEAIDPYFASTLVWDGMSLEMIYGYWNPMPTMAFAVAVAAILFAGFWLLQRFRRVDVSAASAGIYGIAKTICAALTPPLASRFGTNSTGATSAVAQQSRRLYTGNAQSYNLYISILSARALRTRRRVAADMDGGLEMIRHARTLAVASSAPLSRPRPPRTRRPSSSPPHAGPPDRPVAC